jgi:hypothetical protein
MKKNLLIAGVLSGIAICAIASPPGTRDDFENSFAVKPGGTLNIDADLGNVEIKTGDSGTVRVEFIREFKVSTAAEANELREKIAINMALTGNTVKVTVRLSGDRKDNLRRKVRLDFRIVMPRKFNLELRTAGGAMVDDLDGSAKARTEGGSLKLGNTTGAVMAKSEGGSVTIGNVGGNLEGRSEGGSATIGRVNGRVIATAEGGSVSIEEAKDAIEARAAGGSVKAWISKQPQMDSKITAEAGNIDLRLNASIAVNVDAACTAGRLSSDFSGDGHQVDNPGRLKSSINGGGPLVLLRASAGNISLHK